MENIIYLDNAATTFPKPEVVYSAMDSYYRKIGVNAGRGSYILARKANELIDETRSLLAEMINFKEIKRVIFTPSATIAMNKIINGLEWDEYKTVYVTPFEHNAVMRPLKLIQDKYKINIKIIPFDKETFELDEDTMKLMFSRNYPDYIFMSHVSNVTGYILPIEKIIDEAKKYNSVITIDCAQSIGLIPLDIKKLNVDFLVFAGHKTLYGPFGVGGFVYKSDYILKQFIAGGTGTDSLKLDMPDELPIKYEPSSYNIQAICGLKHALSWIKSTGIKKISKYENKLSNNIINELNDIYGIKSYVPQNLESHTSIISFNIEDFNPNEVGQVLDKDFNIAVRTGYHCAPLIHDFLGTKDNGGTIRVSISYFNKEEDIEYLANSLEEIIE